MVTTYYNILITITILTVYVYISGNGMLFEVLKETIVKYYPEWAPEALPMHMLGWSEMAMELELKEKSKSS